MGMTLTNSLVLRDLSFGDRGLYTCKASNANGEAFNSTFIEVIRKYKTRNFQQACKFTVKPALSGHSKRTPKLVFKADYRLMPVKSIAECSLGAFCNTFDLQ